MRLRPLLAAFAAAAVVGPPAAVADALPVIVVQVTRPGWVDVTMPKPFDPDVLAARYAPQFGNGRHAGFVAEPLDEPSGEHAFAIVSVRWPTGSVTNIRQDRAASFQHVRVLDRTVDAGEPAPAGRWRFHLFGDSPATFTVPAPGLPASVEVRPHVGRPRSRADIRPVALPLGQGRMPFSVRGRSAVLAAVMTHHAPGMETSAVCLAEAGAPCADPDRTRVFGLPATSEWWETRETMAAPGTLPNGDYETVYGVATGSGYDAFVVTIVVDTPR